RRIYCHGSVGCVMNWQRRKKRMHELSCCRAYSRRVLLARAANGFGAAALAGLMSDPAYGAVDARSTALHHPPRAKSVIFLYMDGGPSQVDTFDPKPLLRAENGQPFKMKMQPTQFDNNGSTL